MFRILYWKEIREHLMTFRFAAALITIFILIITSVWVLGDDFLRRRDTYNKLAERSAIEARDFRVPSRVLPTLHYPPSPLGIFAQGEEKHFGNAVKIHRWEVPSDSTDSLMDNMLLAPQSSFDLLTIVSVVLSLFGILLSYDSITGEKEKGTLAMICSSGTKRGTIISSKFAAGATILGLPFLFGIICGLIVLQFIHKINFEPIQWLSFVFIVITALIFGSLFIAVGILCSSLFKRSSSSLIFSLLIWTLGVILLPKAGNSLSSIFYPTPSPAEIETMKVATNNEVQDEETRVFWSQLSKYQDMGFRGGLGYERTILRWGTPEAFKAFQDWVRLLEPLHLDQADKIWQLVRTYVVEFKKQARCSDLLSSPAPSHHLRKAFTALAGTDSSVNEMFIEAARRFRISMIDGFRKKGYYSDIAMAFVTQIPLEVGLDREKIRQWQKDLHGGKDISKMRLEDRISEEHWKPLPADIIPPFNFKGGLPLFHEALVPVFVLIIYTILVFTFSLILFLRYDIR